jgi:hypothetical protein
VASAVHRLLVGARRHPPGDLGHTSAQGPQRPFDARHSWLLGDQRAAATVLALVAAALLGVAGIGLWAHAGWWRPVAAAAVAVSFGLMVFYFHPWFGFIQVVNAGLVVAIVWLEWPTTAMVGA